MICSWLINHLSLLTTQACGYFKSGRSQLRYFNCLWRIMLIRAKVSCINWVKSNLIASSMLFFLVRVKITMFLFTLLILIRVPLLWTILLRKVIFLQFMCVSLSLSLFLFLFFRELTRPSVHIEGYKCFLSLQQGKCSFSFLSPLPSILLSALSEIDEPTRLTLTESFTFSIQYKFLFLTQTVVSGDYKSFLVFSLFISPSLSLLSCLPSS